MMPSNRLSKMLPHKYAFTALGTQWQIESDTLLPVEIKDVIMARVEEFDKVYSRFRADSLVSRLARRAGTYTFPEDAIPLIQFYRELYELTDRRVTPLIGAILERAGYDADYSLIPKQQLALPGWDQVMEWRGATVRTMQPIVLDVGAAGKGYVVDLLADLLTTYGIKQYIIDASGDVIAHNTPVQVIGLEHPQDPTRIIGTMQIANQALCASATNRRAWGKGLHHIFDPHTKQPAVDVVATWVVATSCLVADGLATALFFTSPVTLGRRYDFQYVRLLANGGVEYSSNLTGEIFE